MVFDGAPGRWKSLASSMSAKSQKQIRKTWMRQNNSVDDGGSRSAFTNPDSVRDAYKLQTKDDDAFFKVTPFTETIAQSGFLMK